MTDVDYSQWADYIEKIFMRYGVSPKLVADLGCGTGSFCIEMARRGYDMTGIDLSPDMLSCAVEKSSAPANDNGQAERTNDCGQPGILWLNQDMTSFELYGTMDSIVCLLDSINNVVRRKSLERMFRLVRNYLNPGGLFIFDVNSPHKLENVLGDNVFYSADNEVSYIWQNDYNKKTKTCRFELTFFEKKGDLYERFDEVHFEKAYSQEDLTELMTGAGLELLGVFDGLSFRKAKPGSERIFYVCKKK